MLGRFACNGLELLSKAKSIKETQRFRLEAKPGRASKFTVTGSVGLSLIRQFEDTPMRMSWKLGLKGQTLKKALPRRGARSPFHSS